MHKPFASAARWIGETLASPWALAVALTLIAVYLIAGPRLGFPDQRLDLSFLITFTTFLLVIRAQRLRRRPAGGGVGCRLIAARHGLCRTTPGRLSKRRRGGRGVPAGAREPRSEEIVEDSEIVTLGDESLS